jgi:hypothetical protein
MRRPIGIALAGLLLLVPSAASAKEVSKVTACGAHDCVTLTAHRGDGRLMVFAQGDAATKAPRAAGWFRLTLTVSEGPGHPSSSWSNDWVPSVGLLRTDDPGGRSSWLTVPADTERALNRLTRTLTPYPAARLRGLHEAPLQAQVSEVVNPPAPAAPPAAGSTPWAWLAVGGAALVLALALAGRAAGPSLGRRLHLRSNS